MVPYQLVYLSLPIGNLEDISQRALQVLKNETVFIVEDTRNFMHLLQCYQIPVEHKKIVCWQDHSNETQAKLISRLLTEHQKIYICSDAGSPILSDPGHGLKLQLEELLGPIPRDTIPGCTSVVAALELSGLAPIPFHFWGFCGRKEKDWQEEIKTIQEQVGTHIYFVSPHKVVATVSALSASLPHLNFVLVREATKKFQQVIAFKGSEWEQSKEALTVKGEFVLLIQQDKLNVAHSMDSEMTLLAREVLKSGKKKPLAKLLSAILNEDASTLYSQLTGDK
jgi:16S rRNA (cytidine1402-2'-O)-methyltransferase